MDESEVAKSNELSVNVNNVNNNANGKNEPLIDLPFLIPFAKNPYLVYLPGATGGGVSLTALRQFYDETFGRENACVPSSLSTPFALQEGEDAKKHYARVAEIIARGAGDRPIQITAHSSGGNEAEELIGELIKRWHPKGGRLDMVFYAVPGLSPEKSAANRTIEFLSRFWQIVQLTPFYEQFALRPLPEDLVGLYPPLNSFPEEMGRVFADNPQERARRRERFDNQWLPALAKQIGLPSEEILNKLAAVEEELRNTDPSDRRRIIELLMQRGKILKPAVEGIYKGHHIRPEEHLAYLARYRELTFEIAESLPYLVHGLIPLLAKISRSLFEGFDASLERIVKMCKNAGVQPVIYLGVFGNDVITRTTDLPGILDKLKARRLSGCLGGVFGVDTLAHSSIAYEHSPLKGFTGSG